MTRELHKSKNPWKWEKINPYDESEAAESKIMIRKVRSILNRLTPTNEELLTKEFFALNVLKSKSIDEVVSIIFMKSVNEPKFVEIYSRLCYEQISEEEKINNNHISFFRSHLLLTTTDAFDNIKNELRRTRLGIIRLMGHLYLQDILSVRVLITCFDKLLKSISDIPDILDRYQAGDESIEEAIVLLEITGKRLQQENDRITDNQHFHVRPYASLRERRRFRQNQMAIFPLDVTFQTLEKAATIVRPRTRILIMNLIELRSRDWVPRRAPEVPKTLAEIRAEVQKERMENEELRKQFDLAQGKSKKERGETRNAANKTKTKYRAAINPAIELFYEEQLAKLGCAQFKEDTASKTEVTRVSTKNSIDTSIAVDSFDDLSDQCSCPICHEIFDSANFIPYILNCGHSFCKVCVAKVCINNEIKCSLCKNLTELPEGKVLSTNYQLLGISEKVMNSRVEAKLACKICDKKFSPDGICVCMKAECDMFNQLLCLRCALQGQHGAHIVHYDAKMVETRDNLRQEVAAVCAAVDEKKRSVIAKAEELEKITQEMKKRLSEAKIPDQIIAQIDSLTSDQDVSDYREIVNDLAKTLIEGCEAVEEAFNQAIMTANQQFELVETKEESA